MGGAPVTNGGAAPLLATGGWPRAVAGAASLSIQPRLQLELRIPDNSALPPAVRSLPTGEQEEQGSQKRAGFICFASIIYSRASFQTLKSPVQRGILAWRPALLTRGSGGWAGGGSGALQHPSPSRHR